MTAKHVSQDGEIMIAYHATATEVSDKQGADIHDIDVESITIGSLYLSRADALRMDHAALVAALFNAAYHDAIEGEFE